MTETLEAPEELSIEEGESAPQLKELLDKKLKEKYDLEHNKKVHFLRKSKFYYGNNKELREHIATYNGYAIMIKQENIKEEINTKENKMFPTLVSLNDLKKMKKVNGNVVRKINPKSIHEIEKFALIQGVISTIDKDFSGK